MNLEELFDGYLNDELGEKEKALFENRLEKETDFKEEFENFKIQKVSIESYFFKEKISNLELDKKMVSKSNNVNLFLWIFFILSALALLFYFLKTVNNKPEFEFSAYYSIHPGIPVTMSATNQSLYFDGMIDYKEREMELALDKWNNIKPEDGPFNDSLTFFQANAFLYLGEFQKAIPYLERLVKDQTSFASKAEWIIALINYEKENRDGINDILEDPSHPYYDQAIELEK